MSDYFPPEIILHILHKLPAKSLIRFTTVCKSWRSIITSPSFISSHLYKPRNETLLLRRYDIDDKQEHYSLLEVSKSRPFTINSSSEIEFPLKSQNGCFRIVGSCRGVICLNDTESIVSTNAIILCNPSIRKHVVLPKPKINWERPRYIGVGFGVADHDFKVVRLVCYRHKVGCRVRNQHEVEVFSLRAGKWRRLGRLHNLMYVRSHIFLNGVMHWLGYKYHRVKDTDFTILVFRVAQEVFDEMKMPRGLVIEDSDRLEMTLIGESLALIRLGRGSCEVWLMKEYGVEESWTRLYSFSLLNDMYRVLILWKNGQALMVSEGTELAALDFENLEAKSLGIRGTVVNPFYVEDYVESLELLAGQSEIARESRNDAEEDLI